MSVFWAILIAIPALLIIPLIFEWTKGAHRQGRFQAMQVGDARTSQTAGSVDYAPGPQDHRSHDGGWSDGLDGCGSDGGSGDGGGD